MNCISLSLFGIEETHEGCFSFESYLRYFALILKMKELIFPEWDIFLNIDSETYNSRFKKYFDYHADNGKIDIDVHEKELLCMAMLHRLSPIFSGKYERIICRDLDALITYRERQAVEQWIKDDTIFHTITDSISHNIPIMGGMCGAKSDEFKETMGVNSFDEMVKSSNNINYSIKGGDQLFLNQIVLPKIEYSITEHYILGMVKSDKPYSYNYIQDIKLSIPDALKESNNLTSHIGGAYGIDPVLPFIKNNLSDEQKEYFDKIEKEFKYIFYWNY